MLHSAKRSTVRALERVRTKIGLVMATGAAFPTIDFSTVGPAVGTPFPDIVLPDQHGRTVDLHATRAGRRALVVFYRSARW